MAERKRVYSDADGFRTTLIVDEEADSFVIHEEENIGPLLDSVARDREIMANNGANKLLGRVPRTVANRACREQWDEEDWRRWWNGRGPPDLVSGRACRIWNPGGEI